MGILVDQMFSVLGTLHQFQRRTIGSRCRTQKSWRTAVACLPAELRQNPKTPWEDPSAAASPPPRTRRSPSPAAPPRTAQI